MTESFEDQLSRINMMASGNLTWDLSPNDQAALRAVLDERERTTNEVASVLMLMDELADLWGDEAVFRRCRDRLRKLVGDR